MKAKLFELRDRMTFIPVLAVQMTEPENIAENFLLARSGYPTTGRMRKYVLLTKADGRDGKASCDPFGWGDRTYATAHDFIERHFDVLQSGAVIDVEHLLGETTEAKITERLSSPWS